MLVSFLMQNLFSLKFNIVFIFHLLRFLSPVFHRLWWNYKTPFDKVQLLRESIDIVYSFRSFGKGGLVVRFLFFEKTFYIPAHWGSWTATTLRNPFIIILGVPFFLLRVGSHVSTILRLFLDVFSCLLEQIIQ